MSAGRGANKQGRSRRDARHVRLYVAMLKSEPWKSLGAHARCAYIEIAARYGGPGSNNGRIPYSARDLAASLGVSKATAWRALRELQDAGFIVEMKRGGFNIKERHATEWRLTEFPCDVTGKLPERPR